MTNSASSRPTKYHGLLEDVRQVLVERSGGGLAKLSQEMIETYWKIGERLSTHEDEATNKSRFNSEVFSRLAKDLSKEYGQGFSEVNLRAMRRFYQNTRYALSANRLTWAQYLRFCRKEAGHGTAEMPAMK
jgi:hypothetical protein